MEAPAWSPDGQRIAAYSIFYDDVIIMDADGSNVTPMQLYPVWPDRHCLVARRERDWQSEVVI